MLFFIPWLTHLHLSLQEIESQKVLKTPDSSSQNTMCWAGINHRWIDDFFGKQQFTE